MSKCGKSAKRYRKWTSEECSKILDYLRLHPFEKPTNLYYKKMTEQLGLKFNPDLARKKVCNLTSTYNKAKNLIRGSKEFPTAKVLKICPYYRQLHELFKDSLPARRKTVCAERQTPVKNWTLLQLEGMSTDLDDILSECSTHSPRILVESPFDPSDIVKIEQENTSLETSEPMETTPNSIEIPSSEQTVLREHTQDQPEGGGRPADAIESENSEILGPSVAATLSETARQKENEQATTVEGCHTSEGDIKIMEIRLREKELMVKVLEIESNERLARLQLESKERILMRKLDLKYART